MTHIPDMAEPTGLTYPVYMVRHGQTALNAQGRFQGRLDEPLNEIGHGQAILLAAKIRQTVPTEELSRISLQTSPLQRATMTMDIIASELGAGRRPVTVVNELAEMDFGKWEGLTTHEVKEKYPKERKNRKADRWNYCPPGGESFNMLSHRVLRWFHSVNGPVLAVTHLGVMRVSAVVAGNVDIADALTARPEPEEVWLFADGNLTRA